MCHHSIQLNRYLTVCIRILLFNAPGSININMLWKPAPAIHYYHKYGKNKTWWSMPHIGKGRGLLPPQGWLFFTNSKFCSFYATTVVLSPASFSFFENNNNKTKNFFPVSEGFLNIRKHWNWQLLPITYSHYSLPYYEKKVLTFWIKNSTVFSSV